MPDQAPPAPAGCAYGPWWNGVAGQWFILDTYSELQEWDGEAWNDRESNWVAESELLRLAKENAELRASQPSEEDRGWQDQEQEADGVEWAIEGEWAVTNTGTWLKVNHRASSNWEWEAWAPCVDTITGTAPTREEARRQAVEAARGMG